MTLRRVELVPAAEVAPESIAPWFAEAWSDMYGPATPPALPDSASWLRGRDEERLVALLDGEPLAFAALRQSPMLVELVALAVASAARNEGAGAEIVAQIEQRTDSPRLRAFFPHANGYAFYFWLRCGYRPVFARGHGRTNCNAVERVLR